MQEKQILFPTSNIVLKDNHYARWVMFINHGHQIFGSEEYYNVLPWSKEVVDINIEPTNRSNELLILKSKNVSDVYHSQAQALRQQRKLINDQINYVYNIYPENLTSLKQALDVIVEYNSLKYIICNELRNQYREVLLQFKDQVKKVINDTLV